MLSVLTLEATATLDTFLIYIPDTSQNDTAIITVL